MAKSTKHHITHFKRVEIKGYKSIKHLTVEFLPGLNIMIGKNNAGKTNFLDCLNDTLFLHQRQKNSSSVSIEKTESNQAISFSSATIEMVNSNQAVFTWRINKPKSDKVVESNKVLKDNDKRYLPEEKILYNGETVYDTSKLENGAYKRINREIILEPLNLLPNEYETSKPVWTYVKFNLTNNLSFLQDPGYFIARRASGSEWNLEFSGTFFKYFSSFPLDSLFLTDTKRTGNDTKNKLLSSLKFAVKKEKINKFSPIQDFRLSKNINVFRDKEIIRIENLFIEFLVEGTWMPWSNLSDGTKRIFYLLFEVARINQGVILIDEPELGIHPHQFYQLMLFLKEEAEQKQIIMATHAPQTLDFISPEELNRIFIASYDKKLGTQIRPLTEEQKEKAKHYMKNEFLRDYWLASDLEV